MSDDDRDDHDKRLEEAKAAKAEGMATVEEHANDAWKELMLEMVRQTAMDQPFFTSDDPIDRYDAITDPKPRTHELRAMGPVMNTAAKLGYCQKAPVIGQPSRRRSLHASPRTVWKSLIYEW